MTEFEGDPILAAAEAELVAAEFRKTRLRSAAHSLYEHLGGSRGAWSWMVGEKADGLVVMARHEREDRVPWGRIPATWEGFTVERTYIGPIVIG